MIIYIIMIIKIIDKRKNDNLGTFLIKVGILGNIIEQIKPNKNINDELVYLTHEIMYFFKNIPLIII